MVKSIHRRKTTLLGFFVSRTAKGGTKRWGDKRSGLVWVRRCVEEGVELAVSEWERESLFLVSLLGRRRRRCSRRGVASQIAVGGMGGVPRSAGRATEGHRTRAQRVTTRVAGIPHGLSEPCGHPGSEQPLKAYGSRSTLSFPGVFFA